MGLIMVLNSTFCGKTFRFGHDLYLTLIFSTVNEKRWGVPMGSCCNSRLSVVFKVGLLVFPIVVEVNFINIKQI